MTNKMKENLKLMLLAVLILNSFNSTAKKKQPDTKQNIERIIRNVAVNIIQNSSFKIISSKTGDTYQDSKKLPFGTKTVVESSYNKWHYRNMIMNIGFLSLGSQKRDNQCIECTKRNVTYIFVHDDFFLTQYNEGVWSIGMEQKFRMSLLDDVGVMGASVLAVHTIDPQKRFRQYLDSATTYITIREKRLEDGTFCRKTPFEMTVWADDFYNSVPFLDRMGEFTGKQKIFDEAVKQVVLSNKHFWLPHIRLFYHCWYDDIKQNGVANWGRCNGWIIMAQVELFDKLPAGHPQREELIHLPTRQIVGLSSYKDASGMWYHLIDLENTYLETLATAIFTYAIKGINEGWLDFRYAYIATQGWEGWSGKIMADG